MDGRNKKYGMHVPFRSVREPEVLVSTVRRGGRRGSLALTTFFFFAGGAGCGGLLIILRPGAVSGVKRPASLSSQPWEERQARHLQ